MNQNSLPKALSLSIERTFAASCQRVWEAWTEPEQMRQWSCPQGFTATFGEGDIEVGSKWRFGMKSPDGTEYIACGEYREVKPPEKLVMTHAWETEDGTPDHETLVTVTLTEADGQTIMLFQQWGFLSAESRDGHEEGWNESFDKLSDLLS